MIYGVKDLWNRWILSLEWKREEVMDGDRWWARTVEGMRQEDYSKDWVMHIGKSNLWFWERKMMLDEWWWWEMMNECDPGCIFYFLFLLPFSKCWLGHWTWEQEVMSSTPGRPLLYNDPGQVGQTFVPTSVTKKYSLVLAKRRLYSAAGKVTAGLAESNGILTTVS